MHAYYFKSLYLYDMFRKREYTSLKLVEALNEKSLRFGGLFCGDEWARTTDSRIFSPMLYQLSYITVFLEAQR